MSPTQIVKIVQSIALLAGMMGEIPQRQMKELASLDEIASEEQERAIDNGETEVFDTLQEARMEIQALRESESALFS